MRLQIHSLSKTSFFFLFICIAPIRWKNITLAFFYLNKLVIDLVTNHSRRCLPAITLLRLVDGLLLVTILRRLVGMPARYASEKGAWFDSRRCLWLSRVMIGTQSEGMLLCQDSEPVMKTNVIILIIRPTYKTYVRDYEINIFKLDNFEVSIRVKSLGLQFWRQYAFKNIFEFTVLKSVCA